MDKDIDDMLWRMAAVMTQAYPGEADAASEGTIAGFVERGDHGGADWWRCVQDRIKVILASPDQAAMVKEIMERPYPLLEAGPHVSKP